MLHMRKKQHVSPAPPEDQSILEIDVSEEMQKSFLEYAYSVIYARALPDARDGLKPVQRRILFQMDQMGLAPSHGHVKSQRVVGEVMGKLHPHGDSAIYDALVRMAQSFNLRVPLVDGHGNFGSLDDGPAAARYTEARLQSAALDLVSHLDENVVTFVPNYDNQFMEPEVLPAGFPNLLVNGAAGIAVGMATNIPPHNPSETIAASIHLLNHPEADTKDLMRFIPGPDLPGGGVIVGLDGIRDAYENGRGTFRTRARVSVERTSPRKHGLVVTELPYMVGPERVIEKIKDNVSAGRIKGISSVQNLTDRHHGLQLVIEIKNGFNPEAVLQQLYRRTPLEESFAINTVALVDGQPRTLGLREILRVFLDHRIDVITRRSNFRLNKYRDRLHLLQGLLLAIADIDEVIAIIRASDDVMIARERLITAFNLSDVQADYILGLRLRRLTKFSRIELETERDDLREKIHALEQILSSPEKLRALVERELREVGERIASPRRTLLLSSPGSENASDEGLSHDNATLAASVPHASGKKSQLSLEISDDPCIVVLSSSGRLARVPGSAAPPRGPRARDDGYLSFLATTARAQIAVVTSDGRAHRVDVVDLPELPRNESGMSFSGGTNVSLLIHSEETPLGLIDPASDTVIAMGTAQGTVKRLRADIPNRDEWEIISLTEDDYLVGMGICPNEYDLVFITSDAQLLRTHAEAVRPQGRTASGVVGITCAEGATVIGFFAVSPDVPAAVVTVAAATGALPGTGQTTVKVSPLDVFPFKGRGTRGVRAHRFLSGEDRLDCAWAGPTPAHASKNDGTPVDLPEVNPRRDGSGEVLTHSISTLA